MNTQLIDNQVVVLREYQKKTRQKTEEIAETLNVSPSLLYKIYNNERNASPELLHKIEKLIFSEANIAEERKGKYVVQRKSTYEDDSVEVPKLTGKVPYYDIDVTAGNVTLYSGSEEVTDYYSVPKEISDVDFCFKVRGDSMYDKILPGAIVFVKEINDVSVIEYGQVFIIITAEQRMVKYVRRHPTKPEDMVLLRSHNNHYDDIDLMKNKITKLLLVKGYLNNYVL